MINLGLLLLGLLVLMGGADVLVRGVSSLAQRLGIPPVIIGLTVVAFGTSTPELVLSALAAWRGETGLTFGNIVGANTANIGLVLGVTALIRPIVVETSIITREIPMMLLGIAALVVLSMDHWLNGVGGLASGGMLHRGDGLMLLLLFGVFLYYTIMDAFRRLRSDPFVAEVGAEAFSPPHAGWRDALFIIGGLVGVGVGARLAVGAAVALAEAANIGQHIIALTIVSWGTTLPELATGIMAARRGQGDIAIGNVVGSVIYNALCIGGIVAIVSPIPLPEGGYVDLLVMAGLAAALLPLTIHGPRNINRFEGGVLLAAYALYAAVRVIQAL